MDKSAQEQDAQAQEDYQAFKEKEHQLLEAAQGFFESFEQLNSGKPFEEFGWIRLGNLYALASICYYKYDLSPISDSTYDRLCKYLLDNLEEALGGRAGGLGSRKFLDAEMLRAGSGYDLNRFDNFLLDIAYFVNGLLCRQGRVEE